MVKGLDMEPIGFYPFSKGVGAYLEPVCADCYERHGMDDEGGDRCDALTCCGWRRDDSEPIWETAGESDTPTHCAVCEALIPHRLTREGYAYVAEALALGSGRPDILAAWRAAYAGVALDAAIREAAVTA